MTQSELKELLTYDPITGVLMWRVSRRGWVRAGREAGSINSKGYSKVQFNNTSYLAHRLAFLYMDGALPMGGVDHINGVCNDNRWANLRLVTCAENQMNASQRVDNSSGHTGVSWHKITGKWVAYIKTSGRHVHLGVHADINDAIAARKSAEIEHGFHPNHGRTTSRNKG